MDNDDKYFDGRMLTYGRMVSSDIDRALRVAAAVQSGYVWVNGVGTHYRNMPYGGMKNSGTGREEGLADILGYTEEKSIHILVNSAS
jgi:betaine-aldehyde dehydrogenase